MTNLVPVISFDPVPELETTTVALGGPNAPMNSQGQALANRTQWLYNFVTTLSPVASSGDYNVLINKPALGTAAYQNSSAFATAAQGARADGAAQASSLAAVATSGSYLDLSNRPTILPDAPVDGNTYGRRNGAWAVVSNSGGGVTLANTSPWTKNQYVSPAALTYATSVTPDASASNNFTLTLTGDCAIQNPINLQAGMVLNFCVDQDATGGHALTLASIFKWPGGTPPVWSTGASAKNFFSAYYDGSILRCNGGEGYS